MPQAENFSIEAAGVAVNRCATTILKALGRGELRGIRRGKRVYISARELNRWAERNDLRIRSRELVNLALRLSVAQEGKQ